MSDQSTPSFADQFPPLPDGLEELEPDSTFRFECHPGVRCFNRCCHDLVLPLTPYDVMVLCRYLGMDGESFLERYATVRTFPETGFPLPFLNMDDVETLPCPFVGPDGCSVYAARPAACRSYPLGRGSRLGREGVEERHFLVREPHCRGFAGTREWTPLSWREDQGLSPYNAFNDRYMRLMCMVSATGKPLEPQLATLALVCLYQLDAFRALIEEKKLLEHVEISAQRAEDVLFDDEATLQFGLDWLELVIFGQCPGLTARAR
ncbi:MAG TPA: YkgJ family cysteine cluster protein [Candidatus Desulfovibrio gallistercoris]|nr:YkgJ family cysteine cluster protein [Candidatus Desulfovibrio gallistercoris]